MVWKELEIKWKTKNRRCGGDESRAHHSLYLVAIFTLNKIILHFTAISDFDTIILRFAVIFVFDKLFLRFAVISDFDKLFVTLFNFAANNRGQRPKRHIG